MSKHIINPNSIKAVIFDLDGTLRISYPHANDVLMEKAISLGVPDDPAKRRIAARWAHYYWAQSPELYADYQEHTNDADFWTNYVGRYLIAYGIDEETAAKIAPELHAYMSTAYNPEDRLAEEAVNTLEELSAAGYTLGLVSNRSQPVDDLLEELGLSDFFAFSFVAGEIHIWKPDAGIFLHALELAGVEPPEGIYIGDNYYADIVGAQNAGMQAVLYDPQDLFSDINSCPRISTLARIPVLLKQTP